MSLLSLLQSDEQDIRLQWDVAAAHAPNLAVPITRELIYLSTRVVFRCPDPGPPDCYLCF
jgi:hypothetical protein